jgi:hypothetical protein
VAPLWIFILLLILRSIGSEAGWFDILLFFAAAATMSMYFRQAYHTRAK